MEYVELTLPTRIQALDRLLNLRGDDGKQIAFPPVPEKTTTVLIRGGQGAGKTTLALQILSNQLLEELPMGGEELSEANDAKRTFGLFLSLERPAEAALRYAREKFSMKGLVQVTDRNEVTAGKVLGVDGLEFKKQVKDCFSRLGLIPMATGVFEGLAYSVKGTAEASLFNPSAKLEASSEAIPDRIDARKKRIEKDRSEAFDNILAAVLSQFVGKGQRKSENTLWLVIDSLNVLERAIFERTELEGHRAAIQGLANALHKNLKMKVVIIFTGEYHNAIHDVSGASSESFFSDIEILLTQEPVVGIPRTDPRNAAAAGYNIELHHRETYQTGESHHTQFSKVSTGGIKGQVVVETRPFCRVLKSRFSQIQSRRCSYQILPGEGFHFDEIFPGDGYMLLFEDNPKQREDWLDFLLKDCPHEFPALRFELFDRTHQQRVFSTERCFSGHRQHTDLHLASFDTYWIKWFIELNERSIIGRNLRPLRERIMRHFKERGGNDPEDDTRKLFSKAICHLHFKFLDKSAKDWKAKLRTLLPKLGLRIDPAEIDEMLSDEQVDKGIRGCCDELKGRRGILEPIPKGELRLFGEQRSELLADLMNQHPYLENEGMLLSVPFNANISYLVLREDLLDRFADEVGKAEDAQKQWEFLEKIERLLKREREAIAKFSSACPLKVRRKWENKRDQSMLSGDPGANPNEDAQRLLEIKGRLGKGYRPKTWEEIIILCEAYQWEYVVETRSFDTLLCTFLEMLWSCGADLAVNPEYTVNVEGGMIRLYQSVFLFQELLKHVPANSTVDAKGFVENATFRSKSGKVDWAFMRQWHSTFVDMLVAKNADETDYIWKPEPPPGLKIAPLPESFWQFYRKDRDKQRGYGVSSWGDWHLAVLRGSENKSLAVGLLNNMMASSKIANRALQGAALPAVEKFYDIYGDDQCLTLPERGALKMPRQTFNDLKNELFPIAKSRSNIFDYRHCMREIHGFVLELVHARGEKKPEEVCKALQGVFGRIKKLSERELMLH